MGLSIQSEDGKVELFSGSYWSFAIFRTDLLKLDIEYGPIGSDEGHALFFHHSDAEGAWSYEECIIVYDLLKLYEQKLLDKNDDIDLFFEKNSKLIDMMDGLRYCIRHKQSAQFL